MSWRKYQNKIQFRRWLKKGLLVLGLVVLVVGGLGVYRGWQWLSSSQPSSQFRFSPIKWDVRDQINLWLPQENLLLALDAGNETLRWKDTGGKEVLEQSGVPVDGYILLRSGPSSPPSSSLRSAGLRNLLAARSNLSRHQLIRIWWELRSLNENDTVQTSDFSETAIKAERLKIEVLNGSQRPGLAARSAEMIRAVGGEVISVGNVEGGERKAEDRSSKTEDGRQNRIRVYNVSTDSRTVERLAQIFDAEAEWVRDVEPKRVDLVVTVYR